MYRLQIRYPEWDGRKSYAKMEGSDVVHDTTSPANLLFGQLIAWSSGSAHNLLFYHFVV